MGTILKNIVEFTNLSVGVPASQPHRLNVNGIPVVPKLGGLNAEGFTVTANEVNVTVTRTVNAESGSVRVYVEYWHTMESVTPLVPPPGKLIGFTPFFFAASGNDPSPIIVEDEGVPLPNPPHAILDFVGTGIRAEDAGGGVARITSNDNVLVFRPGATGAEAPGGNVFTDWATLMVAVDQTKYDGQRAIDWDNRFAPNPTLDPVLIPFLAFNTPAPAASGLYPCAVPPPPAGQAWDLRDIQWLDRGLPPGGSSPAVQFWDGGPGRPCHVDNIKRIDSLLLNLIYNGKTVGNHPIVSSRNVASVNYPYGIQFSGGRGRIYNTNPSAQPLWLCDIPTNFVNLRNDAQLGNGVALPAPLIELTGTSGFAMFGFDNFQCMDNCFKGPVGSSILFRIQSAAQGGNTQAQTYSNPSFFGTYAVDWLLNAQRWKPSAILTANGNAFMGDVCRVDSSGTVAGLTVTLPHAGPIAPSDPTGTSPYAGSAITVLDVGGAADSKTVTIAVQVGDKLNGVVNGTTTLPAVAFSSKRFWNDGVGGWWIID